MSLARRLLTDLSAVKTTQDESVYMSHLLSGPSSQRTDEFMVQV